MLTTEVTKLVGALGKRGEEFSNSAHKLDASLLQAAKTVAVFGEALCGSEGAKQVETAVGELSRRIKERTDQFADMTAALEKSRIELGSQLSSLQVLRSAVSMVSTQLSAFETELRELSSASMSTEVRNGLMNMQQAIHSSLEASQAIESTMRDVLFFMRGRMTEEHSSGRN
jgi:DNA repair exonuclease SbcCD ATPase subunit